MQSIDYGVLVVLLFYTFCLGSPAAGYFFQSTVAGRTIHALFVVAGCAADARLIPLFFGCLCVSELLRRVSSDGFQTATTEKDRQRFRSEHCDIHQQLRWKDQIVNNDMAAMVFRMLDPKGRENRPCNPCDPSCGFSIRS